MSKYLLGIHVYYFLKFKYQNEGFDPQNTEFSYRFSGVQNIFIGAEFGVSVFLLISGSKYTEYNQGISSVGFKYYTWLAFERLGIRNGREKMFRRHKNPSK